MFTVLIIDIVVYGVLLGYPDLDDTCKGCQSYLLAFSTKGSKQDVLDI